MCMLWLNHDLDSFGFVCSLAVVFHLGHVKLPHLIHTLPIYIAKFISRRQHFKNSFKFPVPEKYIQFLPLLTAGDWR